MTGYGGNEQPHIKKRHIFEFYCPQKKRNDITTMDALPVELVGKIFSNIRRARHVALASATCRKWREAARNFTEKLSFDELDWANLAEKRRYSSEGLWSALELIVVETVMRTTCLKELSISFTKTRVENPLGEVENPLVEVENLLKIHAGIVMACLHHVKQKLKSFKLTELLTPNVNILERLAGGRSVLEHLEWHYAHIPTLSTSVGGFPSLVSLSLDKIVNKMSLRTFALIFSVFPKLEHLCIRSLHVVGVPRTVELNISTLKTLVMDKIVTEHPAMFAIFESSLGRLCVKRMPFGHLHWERGEGSQSMQCLRLQGLHVADFQVGECLGHLELEDVSISLLEIKDNLQRLIIGDSKIKRLKMGKLDSLVELELVNLTEFDTVWLHTYSRIVSKAGSRLCSFKVLAGIERQELINVDEIAIAFPSLRRITMDYQIFYFVESAVEPPLFKQVTHLELHIVMLPEECLSFSQWISGLLQRCPNLKSIAIVLNVAITTEGYENVEFVSELSSLLIPIMDCHPHLDVNLEFPDVDALRTLLELES